MATTTLVQFSQSALTATLTTVLYTVAASTKAIVKEAILCNTDTVSRNVTLRMGDGTAAKNTILSAYPVPAGATVTVTLSTVLVAADTITGGASSAAVVSCILSGVTYA